MPINFSEEMEFSQFAGRQRLIPAVMKQAAWRMREKPTRAEKVLWQELRLKKLGGFRFRQQHVIGTYIADFFCFQSKVVVEVDGGSHFGREFEDRQRDEWMASTGIRVLRFSNEEILGNIENVKQRILVALKSTGNYP